MEDKILYGKICSLCGGKVKVLDRNYLHILSDGTLCQRCDMTIGQLLSHQKNWVADEEYNQTVKTRYKAMKHHSMPLEKARELFALRDRVAERFLGTVGMTEGNVFVVRNVFQMPPSPAIFILRAMKVKNKAVLEGFSLKGQVKKGDKITLIIDGAVRQFTALDVVPCPSAALMEKGKFFDELSTNIHNHTVGEDRGGWIIIDTENLAALKDCAFAAAVR